MGKKKASNFVTCNQPNGFDFFWWVWSWNILTKKSLRLYARRRGNACTGIRTTTATITRSHQWKSYVRCWSVKSVCRYPQSFDHLLWLGLSSRFTRDEGKIKYYLETKTTPNLCKSVDSFTNIWYCFFSFFFSNFSDLRGVCFLIKTKKEKEECVWVLTCCFCSWLVFFLGVFYIVYVKEERHIEFVKNTSSVSKKKIHILDFLHIKKTH